MLILSLDPSLSSTGFAIIDDSNKVILHKGKYNTSSKDGTTDDRIQIILHHLHSLCCLYNIKIVVLEDGFVGKNMQSSLALSALRGAIIAYFRWNYFKVIHNQPKEIRKNFGLKGNATKEEVSQEVLKYYPNLENDIGPYSDKANKNKTSDIYDAISIGLSYILNLEE